MVFFSAWKIMRCSKRHLPLAVQGTSRCSNPTFAPGHTRNRPDVARQLFVPSARFGFRVSGFGFRVLGFGFRVSGFGFRVSGFGSRVSGFGFRVQGSGFRVQGGVVTGHARSQVAMQNRKVSLYLRILVYLVIHDSG